MLEFKRGDILAAPADALVNTVNCVGVMGKGIARQFRDRFPENADAYEAACGRGEVRPGHMFVLDRGRDAAPRYLINFPTKRHWRAKSRLEDIRSGLEALVTETQRREIRSIAIPPLGCGLGRLDWAQVRPLIVEAAGRMPDTLVTVFEPVKVSAATATSAATPPPKMTPGRAVLVGLMHKYIAGLMDPTISLLEVHKLMYFMQQAGEPLRLEFVRAPYGPYAENLRHVLRQIEGHLLVGYGEGGEAPTKPLDLLSGAFEKAMEFLAGHPDTAQRFQRVADLVQGFESPHGLEILATVHWVAQHGEDRSPVAVQKGTYAWGRRKRQFSPRQIHGALDVLRSKGWLREGVAAPPS